MFPLNLYDKTSGAHCTPDPHQFEAYDHMFARHRAALFLGMSLQKTVIALTLLHDLHYEEVAVVKTLVIAPDKVARITWPDEIEKWSHLEGMRYSVVAGTTAQRLTALAADAEVYIVGVDNLVWLLDQYERKVGDKWMGSIPFDCIVCDESSLFKNRSSLRFKRLRRAIRDVEYRYLLTGTPSPNGLIDLWSQVLLLDDGERLGATFGAFIDKYFTTRGNGMIVYEYIPRPGTDKTIAHKLRDIALSMQTRDKLVLPELHQVDEVLIFDARGRAAYDRLEEQYVLEFLDEGGEGVTVKTAADLTTKLLQMSSGAIYEDQAYSSEGKKLPRVWRELNTVKIDALRGLLEAYPGETFLVVYQFRHEIERIKESFPFARELRKGVNTLEDFRDWNAGKIRMLLIHPASAGHGLNLQFGGRRMVWFSLTWNLEHYLQTVARLLRRGQLRDIYVHNLIVEGTRDADVRRRVDGKEANQVFLLNEIKRLREKYAQKIH